MFYQLLRVQLHSCSSTQSWGSVLPSIVETRDQIASCLQVPTVWTVEEPDVRQTPDADPRPGRLYGEGQVHHEVSPTETLGHTKKTFCFRCSGRVV